MPVTGEPPETASVQTQPSDLLRRYKDVNGDTQSKPPLHPAHLLDLTEDASPVTSVTPDRVSRLVYLLDEGEVANLSPLMKHAVNEFFPEGALNDPRPTVSIFFYIASRQVLLSATAECDAEHGAQAHDSLLCASFAGLTYLQANPDCLEKYLSYDIKQGRMPDAPEISDEKPSGPF
jgi:hypothetical protein